MGELCKGLWPRRRMLTDVSAMLVATTTCACKRSARRSAGERSHLGVGGATSTRACTRALQPACVLGGGSGVCRGGGERGRRRGSARDGWPMHLARARGRRLEGTQLVVGSEPRVQRQREHHLPSATRSARQALGCGKGAVEEVWGRAHGGRGSTA